MYNVTRINPALPTVILALFLGMLVFLLVTRKQDAAALIRNLQATTSDKGGLQDSLMGLSSRRSPSLLFSTDDRTCGSKASDDEIIKINGQYDEVPMSMWVSR